MLKPFANGMLESELRWIFRGVVVAVSRAQAVTEGAAGVTTTQHGKFARRFFRQMLHMHGRKIQEVQSEQTVLQEFVVRHSCIFMQTTFEWRPTVKDKMAEALFWTNVKT